MYSSKLLRYGLWAAVAGTAVRNRREYGVPTAWLTHLCGNTFTLLLPELITLLRTLSFTTPNNVRPLLRTMERRVVDDPRYAGYVAPLALGFIASHPDYSIYHGRWAERTLFGFGADSLPHASAAYALARLVTETTLTLQSEVAPHARIAPAVDYAAQHVDLLVSGIVVTVTLLWEVSEYLAHHAEVNATGRPPSEVNMQWSVVDAVTDSLSNMLGLIAAIRVGHQNLRHGDYRS